MSKRLKRSDFEQDKDYFDYLEIEKNLEECERLRDSVWYDESEDME